MKQKAIVVISEKEDGHIPFVTRYLNQEVIIFDPLADLTAELSYDFSNDTQTIYFDGHIIKDVQSIWMRKPAELDREAVKTPKAFQSYAHDAIVKHIRAFRVLFPDAKWVSDYFAMWRGEYKPGQIALAKKLGFNVPRTVFTSSAKRAESFLRHEKECVVKPISRYVVLSNDKNSYRHFLTRKIKSNEVNFSGLHLAPSIFQQLIEKKHDIKVVVVEEQVFAATIEVPFDKNKEIYDWSYSDMINEKATKITAIDLPKKIADQCIKFIKKSNLVFGVIDLIEDNEGKFWFLENNPSGQWAFIEEVTSQQIGKAFAQAMLAKLVD